MSTTASTAPSSWNTGYAGRHHGSKSHRWSAVLQGFVLKTARLGLLLPLVAASPVATVSLLVTGRLTLWAAFAAALCAYSSYLIDHLSEVDTCEDGLASDRSKLLAASRHRAAGFGAAAYLLALGIAGWQSGLSAMLMLLSFPLAVVIYCVPVIPRRTVGKWSAIRLKEIPGLKAVYTAAFWAWLISFALVFHHTGSWGEHAGFAGFMFLAIFVNTVFCDFKDLERDQVDGVPTLPLALGTGPTFRLLQGVSLATALWLVLSIALNWLPTPAAALHSTRVYATYLLQGGKSGQIDLGHIGEVWADFEFVLWLPSVLVAAALSAL